MHIISEHHAAVINALTLLTALGLILIVVVLAPPPRKRQRSGGRHRASEPHSHEPGGETEEMTQLDLEHVSAAESNARLVTRGHAPDTAPLAPVYDPDLKDAIGEEIDRWLSPGR